MTYYTPSLVTETELRNSFSPSLSTSDFSSSGAQAILQITETYIRDTYFDGTMPTTTQAKAPALAIAMSKTINANPTIEKLYKPIASFSIGDYSVDYEGYNNANDLFAMAHSMLLSQDMRNRSEYIVKVNR